MDYQETFNKVAAHLIAQRVIAQTPDGKCLYRAPHGCKCAIGCLIPDGLYNINMEGWDIESVCKKSPAIAQHLGVQDKADMAFLQALQGIHDGGFYRDSPTLVRRWRAELIKLGNEYDLTLPPCLKEVNNLTET